jgi:hypothetical protein
MFQLMKIEYKSKLICYKRLPKESGVAAAAAAAAAEREECAVRATRLCTLAFWPKKERDLPKEGARSRCALLLAALPPALY